MKKLTGLYDSIHMPAHLENQILNAAPAPRRRSRPAAAMAAVLAVVLLLGSSPTVRAAEGEMLVVTFPNLGLPNYQQEHTKPGEAKGDIVHVNTELPAFAHVEDGRLIFTGNWEEMDITGQITPEAPFFYTYEDEQGYEITLVVGYDDTIENFGTYTWIEKDGKYFTDAGRNIFAEAEFGGPTYHWVQIMWDTLEIPWDMPGTCLSENDVVVDIVLCD